MQKKIYKRLLTDLKDSNYRNRFQNLCCFSARRGKFFNNNLMLVGRAVNEWDYEFNLDSVQIEPLLSSIFYDTNEDDCPLAWVRESWGRLEGYNTKRSAYWRVAKRLSEGLNKSSSDGLWASQIVWSNLYKIAPSSGGNPNDSLCNYQFDACNELLRTEIKEYRPKYIVFLTGQNWFDGFLSDVSFNSQSRAKWVDSSGTLSIDGLTTKIVVAKHPQGKPEAELVGEIFERLK